MNKYYKVFEETLSKLDFLETNIKGCAQWILSHDQNIPFIVKTISKVFCSESFQNHLQVLFLLHEILNTSYGVNHEMVIEIGNNLKNLALHVS